MSGGVIRVHGYDDNGRRDGAVEFERTTEGARAIAQARKSHAPTVAR